MLECSTDGARQRHYRPKLQATSPPMRCKISRSACMSLRPHSLSRKRHVKTYRNVTVSGSASDNSEGSDAMMSYFNVVYRPTNRDVPCWNLKELASGINFTIHINRQYETSPKTGLPMPSIVPFKSELSKSNHSNNTSVPLTCLTVGLLQQN